MSIPASKVLRNPLGGALFLFLIYFGALFGLIFVLCPCIPLMVLRPTWYRKFNDKFVALMPFGASVSRLEIHNDFLMMLCIVFRTEVFDDSIYEYM